MEVAGFCEFQNNQRYMVRPCLIKTKTPKYKRKEEQSKVVVNKEAQSSKYLQDHLKGAGVTAT